METSEYRNVTELKGKTVLITKAEKDNIELIIEGERFFLFPWCRSCEYNDEILILRKAD
jgi:hypothetical protein